MENSSNHQWSRRDLLAAIQARQFVPYFQPKIDLVTGRPVSCETLARWVHPVLGILPPSQFIELMEQMDLIDQLTDCLLHQLLACAQDISECNADIGFAINISPITLGKPHMASRICSLVNSYGVACERITIEVTETACADDFAGLLASLVRLRMQGFGISADDFGVGYSSLQELNRMPFTEIKIDRMFVGGVANNRKSQAILEFVVQLADRLHMRTVAEGIETRGELEFVQSLGCSQGQGFYLGSPMPYEDLQDYLVTFAAPEMAGFTDLQYCRG
ncbi:EAL domain-containing protein [Janthinobacterium sp. 17J80-10]|uniref:EAL domain-containing protein n=1 Tax=Janthinobacterium sp. 17J80-10 TaxID=2497863 RepID=UPI0013E8D613|nr:EAL domain-containing protein [Janthinobacterium sp. 17J80-10]